MTDQIRDERGRFRKGTAPGPGRKSKDQEERYLEVMRETVSVDDWRAVVQRAVMQAKNGNPAARKFLADYLMGLPKQKVEMDLDASHHLQSYEEMLERTYGEILGQQS